MTAVTRSDDPERRLTEALRARATGSPSMPVAAPRTARRAAETPMGVGTRNALVLALLAGAVLGAVLALLSLWAPGVLPALG